ncbi:hypothetical protein Dimus_005586 [Dionaea muscipula]
MEAESPENRLVASVIISAPAMRFVNGEEVQEIEAGPGAALSPPYPLVNYPSSPRCDELLDVAAEDRGSVAVKGPSPTVSALSDAGGGQELGYSLDALKTGGLGNHLAADTVGNSVNPVTSLSYICPSLRADSVDSAAPMLSNNDATLIEGGMVSEEGLVSLAAREALRLSPTDGRRQPPLSPVEPAVVIMRGGLLPGGVTVPVRLSLFLLVTVLRQSPPRLPPVLSSALGPDRLSPAEPGSAVRVMKTRRLSRRLGGLAPSIHGSV